MGAELSQTRRAKRTGFPPDPSALCSIHRILTAIYRIPERDLLAVAVLLDDCVGWTTLDLERALGTPVLWRHFRASDIGYTEDIQVLFILLSYLDRKLEWYWYCFSVRILTITPAVCVSL